MLVFFSMIVFPVVLFVHAQPEIDNVKWTYDNKLPESTVAQVQPALGRCVFFNYSAGSPIWCIRPKEHIVFVGDSVSRYQYLALVYAVHFGRPMPLSPGIEKSITNEKSFSSWQEFYAVTTHIFSPYMMCDCMRPKII